MQQLAKLRQFIEALNLVDANQIDAWAENIDITVKGKMHGDGMTLLQTKYMAIVDIEGWPHATAPVNLLFAHVVGWLGDHDSLYVDGEQRQLSITPTIIDDQVADLELAIEFVEHVQVVEHPEGVIMAFGKRWNLESADINVADELGQLDASIAP